MSLVIKGVILHSLQLDAEEEVVALTRDAELEPIGSTEDFVGQLQQIYSGKSGKALGTFSAQPPQPNTLGTLLTSWRSGDLSFVNMTTQATTLLVEALNRYGFKEQGVLVFVHYNWIGCDYLLVALLGKRASVSVDHELRLNCSSHLDLERMNLAARVDLTALQTDADMGRYLSFIKGRAGRKISDFFLDFLGVEETVDAKSQNKQLIQAVDNYCSMQQLEPQEQQEYKQQVYHYCKQQLDQGEVLQMQKLSEILTDDEQQREQFTQLVKVDFSLDETFPAERSVLKTLTKYSGSGGGVNISFDRALLGERIHYDVVTDTLTIRGTPPNLKDQLTPGGYS